MTRHARPTRSAVRRPTRSAVRRPTRAMSKGPLNAWPLRSDVRSIPCTPRRTPFGAVQQNLGLRSIPRSAEWRAPPDARPRASRRGSVEWGASSAAQSRRRPRTAVAIVRRARRRRSCPLSAGRTTGGCLPEPWVDEPRSTTAPCGSLCRCWGAQPEPRHAGGDEWLRLAERERCDVAAGLAGEWSPGREITRLDAAYV